MNQNALTFPLQQYQRYAYNQGLFPSLCTVQSPDQGRGPTGNLVGTFTNVPGLVDLPCQDAPPSIARVQATEVKAVADIMSHGLRHVLLNQCFVDAPADATGQGWSSKGYRCVIDGVTYDLLGCENDSQLSQTRLDLQLVTL